MSIKVKRRSVYTVEHDGREFEVQHQPDAGIKVQILSDGTAIIGYLCQDDNAPHPLDDCDGMGKVYDRRERHSSREMRADFYVNAFGRTEDGDVTGKPNPLAVLLDVYEHSGTAWSLSGEGTQCRFDTSKSAGVWVPDECCVEHIKSKAIECALPPGTKVEWKTTTNADGTCISRPCKPGEKPYFKDGTCIDERYSNIITYTLPDGRTKGGFKTFASAYGAAAKALGVTLDRKTLRKGQRIAAEECAKGAIEEYNKWLAGDCWGIIVEVHDKDGELVEEYENCWGFIGNEYAEKEVADFMAAAAKKHAPKASPEDVMEAAEEFAQ